MTTTSAPSPSMLVMSKEEHFAGEQISPQGSSAEAYSYLHGGKFWAVTFAMGLIFLLVTMEVSIATTALVAITNELGGFNRASWLLSSYQLGYVGACGASQTIVQL
ncbi:hypothetical protein QQS21_000456 [Conoideocrella luteorostrata]|uniref:Uncharacterized protein n=1 Tax=Conoideocrella luteorostrata TaxID=1105319 RepID=A0AAJ0CYX2_9HYPO|nr:hypothetical protein QQS21_000456 [Conoideocrella luteorostrata]